MITLATIRTDLKDIRYFYMRKKLFEEAGLLTGEMNDIIKKVKMYNAVIRTASPKLYDTYVSLYIKNHTQESFSEELGVTPEHVQRLNKDLLKFLQANLVRECA